MVNASSIRRERGFGRIFLRVTWHPQAHPAWWLWWLRRAFGSAGTIVVVACGLCGCTSRGPLKVTEPTRVEAERSRGRDVPKLGVRWYNDLWHAIADGNLKIAWILADSPDERHFVDALELMLQGDLAAAESAVQPLLASRDSMVRRAARVTYGALLSEDGQWSRLASFSDSLTDSTARALRDDAGVERWAPTFRNIQTRSSFADTAVILPLRRSVTGTPVVPVVVNGVTKLFWLDTGSSITIISSASAGVCRVAPLANDTLQLVTAVGRLPAQPAVVHSIHIGGLELTDAPAMIVDASALRMRSGDGIVAGPDEKIDGVIGFDVIRTLDISIDDVRQRVVIRRPVPVQSKVPHNLSWFGVPIVTVLSDRGSALHLALDTGADETFGTVSMVAKTGADWAPAERRRVRGFGGSALERGLVIPSVRLFLGDVPLVMERVFLYDAQYPTIFTIDGTLGSDLGRGSVLRIDMTNGRLQVRAQ